MHNPFEQLMTRAEIDAELSRLQCGAWQNYLDFDAYMRNAARFPNNTFSHAHARYAASNAKLYSDDIARLTATEADARAAIEKTLAPYAPDYDSRMLFAEDNKDYWQERVTLPLSLIARLFGYEQHGHEFGFCEEVKE